MGGQVWVQIVAVLIAIVWCGVVSFVLYKLVDMIVGLRVSPETEREGLDLAEHGERAYVLLTEPAAGPPRLRSVSDIDAGRRRRRSAPRRPDGAGVSGRSEGRKPMKLIIAVIKPFKLEEVREALTAVGVQGLMVSEVKGYGRQSGHTEIYRGAEYVVNFVPKVRLELVVPDASVAAVIEALATTAKTGKIGDGKIFVLDVEQAMRVRTGETGDEAL